MMTPAEQNIAIAEACGWKAENCWHPCNCLDEYHSEGHWLDSELPSYTTDLNAMHEAENWLRTQGVLWVDYENRITKCATAAQRAEAFLRTLGKWRD